MAPPTAILRWPPGRQPAGLCTLLVVVVDFLEPDTLRFSFAPSWVRYVDAWDAAGILLEVTDDFNC